MPSKIMDSSYQITQHDIKDNYPELINQNSEWIFWGDITPIFQAKEFKISYESI